MALTGEAGTRKSGVYPGNDGGQSTTNASWASSPAVRTVMQANRKRDTGPEKAVRRAVHRLGLRFRVAARAIPSVPRTADLVFRGAQVAVFVDGCFWHACPAHFKPPATNVGYWGPKIERNRARDTTVDQLLAQQGWTVVRVWEHEEPTVAAERIAQIVSSALGDRPGVYARDRSLYLAEPAQPFAKANAANVTHRGRYRHGQVSEALLSLSEASARSGLSTSRLRRLAASGTLRARKAGSYWVVTQGALDELMRMKRPRGVKVAARPRKERTQK